MIKEKRDMKPLLVKVGVALALSLAGFLYSRFKTKRTKPSLPPPLPRPPDHGTEIDARARAWRRDDFHALKNSPRSRNASGRREETYMPKVTVGNSTIVSPSFRHGGDKDGFVLPEFNDLLKEFDFAAMNAGFSPKKEIDTPRSGTSKSDADTSREARGPEKDHFEQEIMHLKNMVRVLRERERSLEVQLLEYYGLREQETAVKELQNQLKLNNMEAKVFSLKIESLQADNERLEAQVGDHAKLVAELDVARSKIKLLKKKLRSEAEQNREQIIALQKRVAKLQEQEYKAAATDADIQLNLKRLKDLEGEAEELRKSNMRLQLENSELARRLESTQILANSILEDPETEVLKHMSDRMRRENEGLRKEIEQLQADRLADVEELVYLKWINACLRHELRHHQPPAGKTVARDLSKTLSPKSEEKAKQLILEYANTEVGERGISIMDFDSDRWSSSQNSYITDSDNFDDSSIDNSSITKNNSPRRSKLFSKLRRLVRGKDGHHHSHVSSADKNLSVEDNESPTGMDAVGESHSVRDPSLSQGSCRHSLDIQRMRGLKGGNIKEIESVRGLSDVGSSPYVYKRFVPGGESDNDSTPQNQLDHESDLMKFASILRDSRGRTGKSHKRSASLTLV